MNISVGWIQKTQSYNGALDSVLRLEEGNMKFDLISDHGTREPHGEPGYQLFAEIAEEHWSE